MKQLPPIGTIYETADGFRVLIQPRPDHPRDGEPTYDITLLGVSPQEIASIKTLLDLPQRQEEGWEAATYERLLTFFQLELKSQDRQPEEGSSSSC